MQDTAKMTRKPDCGKPAPRPLVDEELAYQLLGRAQAEGVELLGPDGLLSQVTKAVLERALAEELTGHLGYEKHDPAGRGSGNSRNGTSPKTVLTDVGAVDLAVPRDRSGTFEPQIVRKGQTRLDGFNDRIIALYARGMTTRDIRARLREIYGVEVSPDLISRVIYTTNLIESMNARLRKVTRNRGQFPSEQAALKVLYLAVRNLQEFRGRNVGIRSSGWKQALQAFTIYFEGRIPIS